MEYNFDKSNKPDPKTRFDGWERKDFENNYIYPIYTDKNSLNTIETLDIYCHFQGINQAATSQQIFHPKNAAVRVFPTTKQLTEHKKLTGNDCVELKKKLSDNVRRGKEFLEQNKNDNDNNTVFMYNDSFQGLLIDNRRENVTYEKSFKYAYNFFPPPSNQHTLLKDLIGVCSYRETKDGETADEMFKFDSYRLNHLLRSHCYVLKDDGLWYFDVKKFKTIEFDKEKEDIVNRIKKAKPYDYGDRNGNINEDSHDVNIENGKNETVSNKNVNNSSLFEQISSGIPNSSSLNEISAPLNPPKTSILPVQVKIDKRGGKKKSTVEEYTDEKIAKIPKIGAISLEHSDNDSTTSEAEILSLPNSVINNKMPVIKNAKINTNKSNSTKSTTNKLSLNNKPIENIKFKVQNSKTKKSDNSKNDSSNSKTTKTDRTATDDENTFKSLINQVSITNAQYKEIIQLQNRLKKYAGQDEELQKLKIENGELRKKSWKNEDEKEELENDYENLKSDYNELDKKYSTLKTRFSGLEIDNKQLLGFVGGSRAMLTACMEKYGDRKCDDDVHIEARATEDGRFRAVVKSENYVKNDKKATKMIASVEVKNENDDDE